MTYKEIIIVRLQRRLTDGTVLHRLLSYNRAKALIKLNCVPGSVQYLVSAALGDEVPVAYINDLFGPRYVFTKFVWGLYESE